MVDDSGSASSSASGVLISLARAGSASAFAGDEIAARWITTSGRTRATNDLTAAGSSSAIRWQTHCRAHRATNCSAP